MDHGGIHLVKTYRIVINLFLSPKIRSPLDLSNIVVMFTVHGDSMSLPPGTFTVAFEH